MTNNNNHTTGHYLSTAVSTFIKALVASIAWIAVVLAGLLFLINRMRPWDVFLGLPLVLVGGGMIVNRFASVFLSIFVPYYNRGICKLCEDKEFTNHHKVKKMLGIDDNIVN